MHTIFLLNTTCTTEQSDKFVFYNFIWTIYDVFKEYQQDFSLMLIL